MIPESEIKGAVTLGNPYRERSVPYSSTARFVGSGTVGSGGLQYGMDALARAQARSADITVTVCGRFTLNSGRLFCRSQEPENNFKMLLKDEKNGGKNTGRTL